MTNKGHHIRLTDEAENKLSDLITHFSTVTKTKVEKASVIARALDEMHEKHFPKKVNDMKIVKRISINTNISIVAQEVAGNFNVFLLISTVGSHLLNRIDLETYKSEKTAIKMTELFPSLFTLAIENGYSLTQDCFVNHKIDREIHLSYAMDTDVTSQRFASILDGTLKM